MEVDLVHVTTSDHFRLNGVWLEPTAQPDPDRVADAVLLIHGVGGNFYQPMLMELAQLLNEGGYGVACFDNTGHDALWARNPESDMCCWRG